MNIRDYSSDFSISIFSQDATLGADLKLALSEAKYETVFETDHSELIKTLQVKPSHCLVIDIETLILPIHVLIQSILNISNEIQFIFLSPDSNISVFEKYKKYNVNFIVDRQTACLSDMILMVTDMVCEKLYRVFQNEQIFEAYIAEKDRSASMESDRVSELASPGVRPYQNQISIYKLAESKEQLLDQFYEATPTQTWLYLKLVPTIQSLVCVSASNAPDNWSEGLSYKIPKKENNFTQVILNGNLPEGLHEYLKNKLAVDQIKFLPLLIKDQIEGLLISSQEIDAVVAENFSLMSLVYANLTYESQPKYLDVEDSLTGFYNELFYKRILDKEVDRACRTFAPVSLIKVKIDKFLEIEASHGKSVTDEIIKKVADQIKTTSRLPDYICRTGENEFSLVLINCHRKGAALRAERLRQSLDLVKLKQSGLRITVSQGISEYPTLAGSIDELNESATNALKFISEKGGGKICIYKALSNHRPVFSVDI
jgi:diguanylate cyclase (GGDEF)-like protein